MFAACSQQREKLLRSRRGFYPYGRMAHAVACIVVHGDDAGAGGVTSRVPAQRNPPAGRRGRYDPFVRYALRAPRGRVSGLFGAQALLSPLGAQ
jgi:hypothetical protein